MSAASLKIDRSTDSIVTIFPPCVLTELFDTFRQATASAHQLIPWHARAGDTFRSVCLQLALLVDAFLVFIELLI